MNQTLHIRQARREDIPTLSEIIRQSFRDVAERFGLTSLNCPTHPSNCEDSWVDGDLQEGIVYYLLEHDSRPMGCVALQRSTPTTCFLERLAVLPESRGHGFGKSLVHHVFREAKKQGLGTVNLAIMADHIELKNWYQRLGFTEKETKAFAHLPFRVTFLTWELK